MDSNETSLTKQERKALKYQEKIEAKETAAKQRQTKKIALRIFWAVTSLAAAGGLVWFIASQPKRPSSEIISRTGFHWHPTLTIYVKGEKQELPPNIGLGAIHQPIHTHDDDNKDGVIHMEFQGLVQKEDTTLGQFFKNWDKDMRSFGTNMRMKVNDTENTEYENYPMQDKDKIELWFD